MILFEKDWIDKHPGAIIDTQTTNTSFLRLAALYREMGIKNNAFHLALLNPELQGIDPHSNDLSVEQMAMVAVECKLNFFTLSGSAHVPPVIQERQRVSLKPIEET